MEISYRVVVFCFHTPLSARAKVLIVLQTKALYDSVPCLTEVRPAGHSVPSALSA